jgi:hypothetical protein
MPQGVFIEVSLRGDDHERSSVDVGFEVDVVFDELPAPTQAGYRMTGLNRQPFVA